MANLDQVTPTGSLIVVSWPKVKNGTGFPARALAIVPSKEALAAQQCIVPGTATEQFSCCQNPEACSAFTLINSGLLVLTLGGAVAALVLSKWPRTQPLLWIAVFFQSLVILWRILYTTIGGYPTASITEYFAYRSADPGDVPSICIPLSLMLLNLKRRVMTRQPQSSKVLISLGVFAGYSVVWTLLFFRSKNTDKSLNSVMFGPGVIIALFAVPFAAVGFSLSDYVELKGEPGRSQIRWLILALLGMVAVAAAACFVRFEVAMCLEIVQTCLFFASVYLFYSVDSEVRQQMPGHVELS